MHSLPVPWPELLTLVELLSTTIVRKIPRNGSITPETCGWHYVEGLRSDDDPNLALFWDKAGLGHNGQRLSEGGHIVCFVRGNRKYISGAEWQQFLAKQKQLLAQLERPPRAGK
jgi:hypothetical protein